MSDSGLTLSLIDDPFFLHTFLEEYISPNVGNDRFSSFEDFIKFCPSYYSSILQTSSEYVDQIKNLRDSLQKVDIKLQKYYDDYDHKTVYAEYDASGEMSIDTYNMMLTKTSSYLTILSGEIFVKNKNKNKNNDYTDKYKFNRYSNSSIKMDSSVETKMYNILNNIVANIVSNKLVN